MELQQRVIAPRPRKRTQLLSFFQLTPVVRQTRDVRFNNGDLLEIVAQYLLPGDLKSLALSAWVCVPPAQKHLFKIFRVCLPYHQKAPDYDPLQFLKVNDHLRPYIHKVIFEGLSLHAKCDMHLALDFLSLFPVVDDVTFEKVLWSENPGWEAVLRPSLKLKRLRIVFVDIQVTSALEILSAVDSCETLHIAGCKVDRFIIHCHAVAITTRISNFVINNVVVDFWMQFYSIANARTFPFQTLHTLVATDVDDRMSDLLRTTIVECWQESLREVHLQFTSVRSHIESNRMKGLLEAVQQCPNILDYAITFTMGFSIRFVVTGSPTASQPDIDLAVLAFSKLPVSIERLRCALKFRRVSMEYHQIYLASVAWPLIAARLRDASLKKLGRIDFLLTSPGLTMCPNDTLNAHLLPHMDGFRYSSEDHDSHLTYFKS